MNPNYPVYVISKGRAHSNLTVRTLDRMRVPCRVVVEPPEVDAYARAIGRDRLMVLPFADLGLGSIPARNAVWDDAVKRGFTRHWILDDNIEAFNRLHLNMKPEVETGAIFRAAEVFVDRYANVGLAGFNYYSFCKATEAVPPYYLNTRIYSCILVNHAVPFRWRGRYNEDTDLSLRVLKAGWCTVLFNAFLAGKVTTLRMKGGNTDTLYQGDGRRLMAESLAEQHPDVARVVWKFGRWHHHVDYRGFKHNALVSIAPVAAQGVDNFGMVLVQKKSQEVTP